MNYIMTDGDKIPLHFNGSLKKKKNFTYFILNACPYLLFSSIGLNLETDRLVQPQSH